MEDFAAYRSASVDFTELLGGYQKVRLQRAERIKNLKAEYATRIAEMKELRSNAANSASRINSSKQPAWTPTKVDKEEVQTAMTNVGGAFAMYGGFFEKMRRKALGREAAAWLRVMDPVFEDEIAGLEAEGPEKWDPIEAEQEAADRDILSALESHRKDLSEYMERLGPATLPLGDPAWETMEWDPAKLENVVRIATGQHRIAGAMKDLPVLAKVPGENVFAWAEWHPEHRKDFVNSLLLRSLRATVPGQLKVLLVDPTSLGEVFSPLLSISAHSEEVVHTKVWTSESDILARLEEASDRVGLIIQKYLTDEYDTLEEYNEAAGEVTEPSVIIAINDFPRGLNARSIEIVKSLAEVGPRCGISLVVLGGENLNEEQGRACRAVAEHTTVKLAKWEVANWFVSSSSHGPSLPTTVDQLTRTVKGVWLDLYDLADHGLSAREANITHVSAPGRVWHAMPPEPWLPEVAEPVLDAVGRQFDSGSKVEVKMDRVWELYAERSEASQLAAFARSDPSTWWEVDSIEAVDVPIGRHGSRGVSTIRFDSQLSSSALLVGRPGSGKSNLLHVTICTLAALYSPEELEMYLLDFKEAVEFAEYAGASLPHARAIALESDRDFGLAVLRHVSAEIERRGRLFRGSLGEQANLVSYRQQTGEQLPRILLVIDEFHRMFDREDAVASEAAKLLDDIIRLGRGFGIHCLLASQTLLGMNSLGRHSLNQIGTRIALPCSDEDSRVIFNDDNPAASLLSRPGEGIKNTGGGRAASNEPFQVPLVGEEDRATLLATLRERANDAGLSATPRVYRRDVLARWTPPLAGEQSGGAPVLRLGDCVALDPSFGYSLVRESGRNMLIVGRNELVAGPMLAAILADLKLTQADGVELTVVDLMAVDGPVDRCATELGVPVRRQRDIPEILAALGELVAGREPSRDAEDTTHLLVVNGLGKVRELDVEDYAEEAQELGNKLHALLRDGPEVGVHTVAWCDSLVNVDRRIGRRMEREFGARVALTMSSEDSLRFCDSEAAAQLRDREALFVDIDHGASIKFQPFDTPELELLQRQATSDV